MTVTQDIALTGNLVANNVGKTITCTNLTAQGNLAVSANSTLSGSLAVNDLTVNDFISAKPYISLKVTTTGGSVSTVNGSGVVTLGTPGTVTLTHLGYNTTTVCTRGTPTNTNYLLYSFTWTGAHPLGANFAANVLYFTSATGSGQLIGVATVNVSATSITVWLRTTIGTASSVLQDGNFSLYTVPSKRNL